MLAHLVPLFQVIPQPRKHRPVLQVPSVWPALLLLPAALLSVTSHSKRLPGENVGGGCFLMLGTICLGLFDTCTVFDKIEMNWDYGLTFCVLENFVTMTYI